jgi:hypothetical protein
MAGNDRQYSAGTVEHSARERLLFSASGKKSGHGLVAWLPAPSYEMQARPPWPPSPPSPRPPVIALLDTGVQDHPWLPEPSAPAFVVRAEDYGWQSPLPDDNPAADIDDYRSHWGHATFIAGLIRRAAPRAQVLSMRVMDSAGQADEDDVACALNWLVANPGSAGGIDVDIVLMALGRPADPSDPDLGRLRTPIQELSGRGVVFVASAGNDGAEVPVYPAAFAAEAALPGAPGLSVVSVGALASPTERASYSNSGPWVTQWSGGTNVISIMPLTTKEPGDEPGAPPRGDGYAWWSGTSFAAARVAGSLAAGLPVRQDLPGPAAGA